jgi:hypothetical protein
VFIFSAGGGAGVSDRNFLVFSTLMESIHKPHLLPAKVF